MKIKIQTRLVYGRPLHYPLCKQSQLLAKLNRKGTGGSFVFCFVDRDLSILKELGYQIEQVHQFDGEK